MRSFDSLLNRFCRKHPRFGIPNLMNYIVIGTVLVYLLDMFSGSGYSLSALLSFSRSAIFSGQVWRLITFVFVPGGTSSLLLFALSLYCYWSIGRALEQEWGSAKFTFFYLLGVVLNALLGLVIGSATMTYINLSLFLAFATLYPDARFIFIIIPVKAKWLGWLDAALLIWTVIQYLFSGYPLFALIPVIAILNYLLFFSEHFAYLFRRFRHKADPKTINFKKAQKKARETKGYMHKCAVCGVTDEMDSNMEFRYCSKCNGYYCYCMNHINNHVHIE